MSNQRVISPREQPPWLTLRRTCSDAESYLADINASGWRVSRYARSMMVGRDFVAGFELDSVHLGSKTVEELTARDHATTARIFAAIQRIGHLCPSWVAPELLKQYPDRPQSEWCVVASEPMGDLVGDACLFRVEYYCKSRSLEARYGYPSFRWLGSTRFVFMCRELTANRF